MYFVMFPYIKRPASNTSDIIFLAIRF